MAFSRGVTYHWCSEATIYSNIILTGRSIRAFKINIIILPGNHYIQGIFINLDRILNFINALLLFELISEPGVTWLRYSGQNIPVRIINRCSLHNPFFNIFLKNTIWSFLIFIVIIFRNLLMDVFFIALRNGKYRLQNCRAD
ncbi:hypothetical protein AE621_01555 [Acidovorax sp. SD340]|nr:hypothetical protein AE621_01555 [Acidovorax sp. SD340]